MTSPTECCRILAVDDSPLILETLTMFFGDRAETANSLPDAIAKLDADPGLRVIIVDFSLAGPAGAAVRELRERFPDRVLIVMSGDADAIAPSAIALGAFRVLDKGTARHDDFVAAADDACARAREAGAPSCA